MGIGNTVWVDTNNDGLRGNTEAGVPGLRMELWTPGVNGLRDNGGGDDVKLAELLTDTNGAYSFLNLVPGVYYVRIPTTPTYYPTISATAVTTDNGVNNDSNGVQPNGIGTAVVSHLITLAAGTEPGAGVDGDDSDRDSTIDFAFANLDLCYTNTLVDNASFEFNQLPNATGTAGQWLGYNGAGTDFGTGINGLQWLGGTNGTSGVGEPIQRVQVLSGNSGSRVTWVESAKARHGRRYMLFQGTNSCVSLRAAGGGAWSTVLQPGREYQVSIWAANASSAAASIVLDIGANAQIWQVINGSTPGLYQNYTVTQSEMNGTAPGEQQCCGFSVTGGSFPAFGSADYNNWSEATANSAQPMWRQFTWRFRIANGATASQIDTAALIFSAGSNSGPIAMDHLTVCEVSASNTLNVGNQIWNDINNNGLREGSELGVGSVAVQLYTSGNNTAGDADDLLVASTTTTPSGAYSFSGLAAGKYVVKVTPPASLPATGGTPVALDNGINNDNNGSQPGGPGTALFSPVIELATGGESISDGDTNPDTELSIDFGIWSGITIGNQVWADANSDGAFQSGTESGIGGVTVQLLDSSNNVLQTTATTGAGVYSFVTYQPGQYRIRIPTPSSSFPLIAAVNDPADNGEDNDSNALQPGGTGTAVTSPLITLAAGSEPGVTGVTNIENTIDFGFRACPVINISPASLSAATQYSPYSVNLSSTGGTGPYTWSLSSGALPAGLTLTSGGVLSGTPNASALPGYHTFTVRSVDGPTGCSATRVYTLTLLAPVVTVTPTTLPPGTQYSSYSQALSATGGTSPYGWSIAPPMPSGLVSLWIAENGPADALAANLSVAYGGLAYQNGAVGRAYNFDGVDDLVEALDSSSLKPVQITLEAWVNPAASGLPNNATVITKTTGTSGTDGYGLGYLGSTSTFGFWLNDRAGNSITTTLTAGTWSHVAATYDGTNMRLYVNGVQVATKAYSTAITHSTDPFRIGNNGGGSTAFKGGIDEAALYDRALSAAEVLARYTSTISGNNGMPAGLAVNATTGALTGIPTSFPATYHFVARASDINGYPGVRSFALLINCPGIAISPATLPNGTQYAAYAAQTIAASGGTAPYAFSVFSGTLPTGMTLDSAGVLSGTPGSNPGLYNFTVQARDANNCTATRAYTLTVTCPPVTLSNTSFGNAQQFAAYTPQTITASGGNAPYAFSISSGALPTGMSLTSAGMVSGTPTAVPGLYTFTVQATDAQTCVGTRSYSITVTCPAITIAPASVPNATQYAAYSQTLTAGGGNGGYAWDLSAGSLPAGLSLSTAGVISGTTTIAATPGSYPFTARVVDSQNCSATRAYTLTVVCPVVTVNPATLPDGTATVAYTQTLTASGGTASYTWSMQSGSLPAGITLSTAGVLSGTTTQVGGYNFTALATDANGCTGTRSYTLSISCPTITINPSSLPAGTVSQGYLQTLSATGGTGPYAWSVSGGTLPAGLSLIPGPMSLAGPGTSYNDIFAPAGSVTVNPPDGGILSVNVGGSAGPADLGIWSMKATGGASVGLLGLGLLETGASVQLDTAAMYFRMSNNNGSLLGALGVGTSISSTWEATATFDKPGLEIVPEPNKRYVVSFYVNGSNGLLQSGLGITPSFSVELLDGAGNVLATQSSATLVNLLGVFGTGVTSGTVTLTYTMPPTLPPGAFSLRFKGSAVLNTTVLGLGRTFATVSGITFIQSDPAASNQARIIGSPLCSVGPNNFTIQALDSRGCVATKNYTMTVNCPALNIITDTLANGVTGSTYTANLEAEGGYTGSLEATGGIAPYVWQIVSGALPPGLSLSPSGTISGVPTSATTASFTVRASDSCVCVATRSYTLTTVCPALTLAPASLGSGYIGVAYSQALSTTDGTSPYTYSIISGSLPGGLALSTAGVISGTPTAVGTFTFDVRSVDAYGCPVTATRSIIINSLGLGNLVWNDLDQDGTLDAGENGISGVSLQLFKSTNTVIGDADDVSQGTTTTSAAGSYGFTGLAPGNYYVRIATPPAATPFSSGLIVTLDNGVEGDNNGSQAGGSGTAITSPIIALAVAREPGNIVGGADVDNTVDFALRAVPAATPLLEYDLNASSNGLPAPPSYQNPCIVSAAKIQVEEDLNGLTDVSEPAYSGPIKGGARSRRVRDWDSTYDTAYDATRASLTQNRDSLWVRFDLDPTTTGNIGKLLFDVQRVNSTSPVNGKAFLTWKDGASHHTATTDTFVIAAQPAWYSMSLNWTSFIGGATALPTGAQLNGKSFLLEIYLWGGDSTGYIDFDNLVLEGNATCDPPTLSIGDFVWSDLNGNGIKNAREPGLANVSVELWRSGTDNTVNTVDDVLHATMVTDANGYYLFSGLSAGNYFVKIPTPNSEWPTASPAVNLDNGVDNDSNGNQPGGSGTAVTSPIINLALSVEPGSTGSTHRDMTVDFGFTANMSIGNLVWSDLDNDGIVDAGEGGVSGVQVELFRSTDTTVNNGDDVKVGSTFTTDSTGAYSFSGLSIGYHYIKLTPPISHPRRSSNSSSSDNGVDNDNNGISQASTGAPIYSMMVNLQSLTEPGNLLAPFGTNAEITIDFGLRPVFVTVGNLVFKDGNGNNRYDSGEGVGGVRVDLMNESNVFVRSTTTSSSTSTLGSYQFSSVIPGNYYVRIPPSEFATGMPLVNTLSISPTSPTDDALDDNQTNGDSGIDAATPASSGISSPLLALFEDSLPTNASGESGFRSTLDDSDDDNGNMTVDFGFRSTGPTETGCYHFVFGDADQDGTTLSKSTEWTPAQAYDFTYAANIATIDNFKLTYDAATKRLALDSSFTQASGKKVDAIAMLVSTGPNPATADHAVIYVNGFNRGAPVITIYRYHAALGIDSWQTPSNIMVSTAPGGANSADVLQDKVTETGSSVRFQFVIDVNRVNTAANWSAMGVTVGTWEGLLMGGASGISLRTADLDSAPTYDATGCLTSFPFTPSSATMGSFDTDPSGVLTIATEPCSVSPWVSLGNLVWSDVNNNGLKDASELGVTGATLQLFDPGADLAIGGSGANADVQVGSSLVTASSGAYSFTNLVPGAYYVRLTPPANFAATGGVVVTSDNNVEGDNNGSQPGGPGTTITSPVIDLAIGAEPVSAVDGDGTSGNATVDFGLWSGFIIGDLVWNDVNNNGLKDTTESGVSGVTVDVLTPGADNAIGGTGVNEDTLLTTTSTNSSGVYSVRSYTLGKHYVRITPTASLSLVSSTSVTTDNSTNNDNNGVQPGGAGSDIFSMVFDLVPGTEPGSTGTTNSETTKDFGLRGCPTITISPTSLPVVTIGTAFSQTLTGSGGNTPYTWSLASGAFPAGISLTSAGVISGTTTAATGNYSVTARLTDASGCQVTRAYTLTVSCPTLSMSPASLSGGTQGTVYSQTITASGGTSPYAWSVPLGSLPPGLTLNGSSGVLGGTPTTPGSYSFTVRATDTRGCLVDRGYTLAIACPTLTVNPTSLVAGTLGVAYSTTSFSATGGTAPYTWSYTGTLPTGTNITSAGLLSGTPNGAPGTYNITVTVTDANLCTGNRALSILVNCGTFVITPTSLSNATQNASYAAQTISAAGGTAPYNWTVSAGALPTGMSFSNGGVLSGTPTSAPGTYNFTARATDAYSCQTTRAYSLVVNCPPVSITTASLAGATQYASYSETLVANSGSSPYTWDITSGALPTGLNLSSGGAISGTPTQLGTFNITFRVTDANSCSTTRPLSITVACPAISLTPTTLSGAQNNVAYSQQLSASGGTSPYVYTRTSGALPTGMTLSSLGLLSGAPTSGPGNYNFTIQAVDASGSCSGSQAYTLTVTCPTVVLSPTTLGNGTVGTAYSVSLSSSGGTAPYAYTITSGSLPAGLSLSGSGLLSGTPTTATTASVTIQTADAFSCIASQAYTLTVVCPAITINPATLTDAIYNLNYSETFTATGGTGPYTWSLVAGVPPPGITLSTAGVLSGKSTTFGTASFTVRATDNFGCQASLSTTLTVKGLSLGNMVWDDLDYSGTHDAGEAGVKDVVVQLWDPGADHLIGGSGPNADVQIGASKLTSAFGTYSFQNLLPGFYYVRVLPPSNLPVPGGNPVDADNNVDNDNNAAQQPDGYGGVIYGPVVELTTSGEPVADDGDDDTDFTVDFGLYRGMSIGEPDPASGNSNFVWQDTNDNGIKDASEPGVDGVTVELWATGADGKIGGSDDVLRKTVTTTDGGKYGFNGLAPGPYYLRIPEPPTTHPLSSSVTSLLDNGTNDDDNGHQVGAGSIYSPVIQLTSGAEVGGFGYNENTIDFALLPVVPTVYVSATQDDSIQTYDSQSGRFTGTLLDPFGTAHNQGDGNPFDVPYNIELGPDGNWYVAHYGSGNLNRITSAGTQTAGILNKTGVTMNEVQTFAIGPDGNFYVIDHQGSRIVRFQGPLGAAPGTPMGASPYTYIARAGIQDIAFGPDGNLYVVIQDGSTRDVRRYNTSTGALMNIIVTDAQIANLNAGGQAAPIISGIDIFNRTLYGVNKSDGEVFRLSLTNPAVPGAPQMVATIGSAGLGEVDTRDLEYNPQNNLLYISGYSWSKAVIGGTYNNGALLRLNPAGAPNATVEFYETPIPSPPGPNNEIWSGPRDLALGKPRSTLSQTVSIGSMVWNDTNGDGLHGAGENGIPNVRVELWRDSDGIPGNGAETRIGWSFTNSRGMFYFSGQAAGVYQLKVPVSNFGDGQPLAGSGVSSAITVTLDNQVDGDDNGIQTGGSKTEVVSPLITLTPGAEPTGDGNTGTESKSGGDLDDYPSITAYNTDADGDMTVDFGFVEPGTMAIGNLVFDDANGNRRYDNGEGLNNVVVQLYYWGQIPGANQPVASTVTSNGGKYLFTSLWQGQYFVHIPAIQFQSSGDLRGLFSLEGVQAGDDDVGEDSVDTLQPHADGISTGRIILTKDSTPTNASSETGFDATSDDSDDANTDLTVDIGLFRPVAIGNLVFLDNNSNNRADSGEGINNVTVELFASTQNPNLDVPLATTTTANGGRYLFSFIRPGNYLVHVPKEMFQSTGPLYRRVSIAEGVAGDDDAGEDGRNDSVPETEGVTTYVISVIPAQCPTDLNGETGIDATSDNENDASVDLTVDLGFQSPVGIGNMVFVDLNTNDQAESNEGIDGVRVEIYRGDQIPGSNEPLFTTVTAGGGKYAFNYLSSGSYILFIPPSQFAPGAVLGDVVSMTGAQLGSQDDNLGEDGIDSATPAITGIRTRIIALNIDSSPVDSGDETGLYKTDDSFDDNNFDLTVDFGFVTANPNAVGIGNLVFLDANANGVYDDGEGLDGVAVHLHDGAANPLSATPVRTTITSGGGLYIFSGLDAGSYKVHIPPSQFQPGAVLNNWLSFPGQGTDNGLDDNMDENGSDGDATVNGVTSTVITLVPDSEPENFTSEFGRDAFMDDANDNNTDLTVDFAFYKPISVGNLVFIDANYNGRAETGEGVAGVEVQIFRAGDSPLFGDTPAGTAVTDAFGRYLITDLAPGDYFLHIAWTHFLSGGPLYLHASIAGTQTFDDNLGEDGVDEARPDINGISTATFTLTSTNCPIGTAEGGLYGSSDDDQDSATDLSRDFGFVSRVQIGNVVFKDSNSDGIFDPNIELGMDAVPLELWTATSAAPLATTTTSGGGLYSFNVAPGTYHIRIPASAFASGGVAANLVAPPSTPNSSGMHVDDDVGQDGYMNGSSLLTGGIRTSSFTVLPGLTPDDTNGETGFLFFDDDTFDHDSDLTVDIGLAPKPIYVGNLVFADVNADGRYSTGVDFGVPGVLVEMYATGALPGSDAPLASTYSGPDGNYLLRAPGAGTYFLHIPASQFVSGAPLASALPAAGFGDDDGTDDNVNEDTLQTASPASTGVTSIVFDLAYDTEPSGSQESGFLGGNDDSFDTDSDLTIDLGFTGVTNGADLGIGNLVFVDANANGHYDSGEGKPGVWVLLYRTTDSPGTAFRTTHTDAQGRYLFSNLPAGSYVVHVAADNFKPNMPNPGLPNQTGSGNGPLYGMVSATGNQSVATTGDDNTGEDGVDAPNPEYVGISSNAFNLAAGTAPVGAAEAGFDGASDNAKDNNYNLLIDFGFKAAPVASNLKVGNLVFNDANGNGIADAGEGVGGVTVQLFAASTTNPLSTAPLASLTTSTITNEVGTYLFQNLAPGDYYVFLPPSNFANAAPLYRKVSLFGVQGGAGGSNAGDDNAGEDGLDESTPETKGVRSTAFTLAAGTMPAGTAETGFLGATDDAVDGNANLTIDLGFITRLGLGNLVFKDLNPGGFFGSGDTTMDGVVVEAVRMNGTIEVGVAATTQTANGGRYRLNVPPGTYKLRIPAPQFGSGTALEYFQPTIMTGAGHDDNTNQDALFTSTPAANGVSTTAYTFSLGSQPTTADGREPGQDKDSDLDEDGNVNLTLDFGLVPKGYAVGNLVFRDTNANSRYDAGADTPISGVTLRLFASGANPQTAAPVAVTASAADGSFMLFAPTAGSYFIHVPSGNFQSAASGALVGMKAAATAGSTTTFIDDNYDQNAVDVNSPSANGISTGVFILSAANMPVDGTQSTGETGFGNTYDNFADTWGNMTIDLGFETAPQGFPLAERERNNVVVAASSSSSETTSGDMPAATEEQPVTMTFALWQKAHPGAAGDDTDADTATNLLEYATGTDAENGASQPSLKLVTDAATGRVDALLTRPTNGRSDIRYLLTAKADARSNTWTRLDITPAITQNNDGSETLRYAGITSAELFTGVNSGLVRLDVQLDANLDGTAEATAASTPQGWLRRAITGRTTLAMPLLQSALFTGKVSSVDDGSILVLPASVTLPSATPCFVEVHSTGERLEIDSAKSTSTRIALRGATAPAAGTQISIHAHWTVDDLLPADLFTAGTRSDSADRVMFFDSAANTFRTAWLGSTGWTGDFTGKRIVAPGEGLLVHARSSTVTLTLTGAVRTHAFHLPLRAGVQFVSSGFLKEHSPHSLGLTNTNGFTSSARPATADRLRLWEGDLTEGAATYRSLFFQRLSNGTAWVIEGDTAQLDQTRAVLIQPGQAFFLLPRNDLPEYREP